MIGARTCGLIKNLTNLLSISNKNFEPIVSGFGFRTYAKDKGVCCKDVAQTAGKKVDPWPKPDPPPPAWRCECPQEPQPVNYDPYRIKVPDVVVPPLPPSNAKEVPSEEPFGNFGNKTIQDLFHNSPIIHPDYWKERTEKKITQAVKEVLPKLGYHGRNKYKYAFHEPWNPLDRMALLDSAEKEELGQTQDAAAVNSNK